MRLLGEYVLVEVAEAKEKTDGGIIIPDRWRTSREGVVINVGDRAKEYLSEGDRVLFNLDSGFPYAVEGKEHKIFSFYDRNITAIREEDQLLPLKGFLFVKANLEAKSSISYGTLKLALDTSYNPEAHAVDFGEIRSLPKNYEGSLKVGDIVYGNHLFIKKENEYYKTGDESVVLIEESEVYCYIRNGKIIPTKDRLIIEPVEEENALPAWLINPFKKNKEKTGRVLFVSEEEQRVKPGDIIIYSNFANYNFSIEGKPYECLHAIGRQLLAVLEEAA